MKAKEFIESLKSLKADKHNEVRKWIRANSGHYVGYGTYCPITALCEEKTGIKYEICDFLKAAKKIKLNKRTAIAITDAVDNKCNSKSSTKYRTILGTIFNLSKAAPRNNRNSYYSY